MVFTISRTFIKNNTKPHELVKKARAFRDLGCYSCISGHHYIVIHYRVNFSKFPWTMVSIDFEGFRSDMSFQYQLASLVVFYKSGSRPCYLFDPTIKENFEERITSVPVTMRRAQRMPYRTMVRSPDLTSLFDGPHRYGRLGDIAPHRQTQHPHSVT